MVAVGSGNDVARSLGLHGRAPLASLVHALNADPRPMDVGCAEWMDPQGREYRVLFLSSFTAGFDSAVVLRTLSGPRWLSGLPRYLWATLVELAHLQTWRLDVTANGKHLHSGPALFASSLNTPTFGSGMPATPAARTNDGLLNLLLAGQFGRLGALAMLPRLLTGTHLGHSRIRTRAFDTLTVSSDPDLPLAADGEFLGYARQLQAERVARRAGGGGHLDRSRQRQVEQQVLRLDLQQALGVHGQAEVDRLAAHIELHVLRVVKRQAKEADQTLLPLGLHRPRPGTGR